MLKEKKVFFGKKILSNCIYEYFIFRFLAYATKNLTK